MPGFGLRIHVFFFDRCLRNDRPMRNLLRQRALSYKDLKQCDRAEADYNAALQIEPLDPDFYAKRGFYFSRRGRHDDALADFRKGGELVPTDGSKIQFNGVGGLPTYISFTQGADDMSDHDKWISYSHWGMFPTGTKYSK
jgi:tetratricopeptide (TPR) repeat protein